MSLHSPASLTIQQVRQGFAPTPDELEPLRVEFHHWRTVTIGQEPLVRVVRSNCYV